MSVRSSDFFICERGKDVRKEEERVGWEEGERGMDGGREGMMKGGEGGRERKKEGE